jgi:D-3-phosphoglycerate dehydrogenase
MAEIAKGFGMQVFAFDPFVDGRSILSAGIRKCDTVEELYSTCQYISLHLPLNNDTIGAVGYNLLRRMPDNAVLVNAARKEIVDEEDLLKMFGEREDFMYLSDIVPDCIGQLEEKYKGRFLFTAKKMGAQTEEANTNAGIAAVRHIVDFFTTGNEKYRVNQ